MNTQQRNDLIAYMKPGDMMYMNGGDWTAALVDFGQGQLDKTWTAQLTHVVYMDKDGNISESTIEFGVVKQPNFPWISKLGVIQSGIKITPINQWAVDDGNAWPFLIVQRFDGVTADILAKATATGYSHQQKGFFYPIRELVGSLIAYFNYDFAGLFKWINPTAVAKWQANILAQNNPLNSRRAEYCIAYVDDCFKSGGFPIIPDSINESVSNLGCGMRRKDRAYTLRFVSHLGVNDYRKEAGQDFNPDCIKSYKQS